MAKDKIKTDSEAQETLLPAEETLPLGGESLGSPEPVKRFTVEQDAAYEQAVNLLVGLLGEVEPLSPKEEEVLEQAVSDSLYTYGNDTCFDNVLSWLGDSSMDGAKSLSRLLGMIKNASGGSVEGGSYGLPHVGLFSTPWVNTSLVSFVSWEVSTLAEGDDTPVLLIGDEYAIVLTPPVAVKMYKALGNVLRDIAPAEVKKPKKSLGSRWDSVVAWGKRHKYFAVASAVVVATVVIGLIYGFTTMSGNIIPS